MSLTNICSTDTAGINLEVEICSVPNVITPNGDNSNDYFYTKYADTYDDVNLIIYNRWGETIFESYDDIVAICCEAWNKLIEQPWKIMSTGRRKWAHGF